MLYARVNVIRKIVIPKRTKKKCNSFVLSKREMRFVTKTTVVYGMTQFWR